MRSYNIPTVMEYIRISLLTENLTVYYLHSFLSIVTRENCPKQHNVIFLRLLFTALVNFQEMCFWKPNYYFV